MDKNLRVLHQELEWLQKVVETVIGGYLQHEDVDKNWSDIPVPSLENDTPYHQWVHTQQLNSYQRLAIALVLVPHIKPELLDIFLGKNSIYDRRFTEFGGIVDTEHFGFLPTGQTLLFLISATNPELKATALDLLNPQNILFKEQVLALETTASYVPMQNGVLSLNPYWTHYFITGEKQTMTASSSFPATKIGSPLDWDALVLADTVMDQVQEVQTWLEHGKTLLEDWGLAKKIKPGYRALFYGPPGTGKTLTATLLGKSANRDVYRIDLSMLVSKYIGETEKNLAAIFDNAARKDWILFFDEADSLFGKRTDTNSSNDRYANQQTSYLLQRIEDFPGVVILASNLKANMDEAFTRRFQSMIHFPMPSKEERYLLWKNAFSDGCTLDPNIDLYQIAEDYELAGGAIINILRYCALACIQRNSTVVTQNEVLEGIRKELKKEHKTMKRPASKG